MIIFMWYREFNKNFSLKDDERTGIPLTSVTEEYVTDVTKMLDEDR